MLRNSLGMAIISAIHQPEEGGGNNDINCPFPKLCPKSRDFNFLWPMLDPKWKLCCRRIQ